MHMHSTQCPCQRVARGAFGQHAFQSRFSSRYKRHATESARPQRRLHSTHTTTTRCTAAQPGLDSGASSPPQRAQEVTPIPSEGRETYRPQSFKEITEDAVKAVLAAIEQGHNRLEVEFPPIPATQSKLHQQHVYPEDDSVLYASLLLAR